MKNEGKNKTVAFKFFVPYGWTTGLAPGFGPGCTDPVVRMYLEGL